MGFLDVFMPTVLVPREKVLSEAFQSIGFKPYPWESKAVRLLEALEKGEVDPAKILKMLNIVKGVLEVEWWDGSIYRYAKVPMRLFREVRYGASNGRAWRKHIHGQFRRLTMVKG